MHETYAALLSDSCAVIAREAPNGYSELRDRLTGLIIHFVIDDEGFQVTADSEIRVVEKATDAAGWCVEVLADGTTITAVIDGHVSLVDAILAGNVRVTGDLGDLVSTYDVLFQYTHASIRAPSARSILERFRLRSVPAL